MSALCKICGLTFSSPSFGGPGVCPSCDCGIPPDVARLRAENFDLKKALHKLEYEYAVLVEAYAERSGPNSADAGVQK